MKWTVETLNAVVDAELEGLPADRRARFHYISQLIEEFGLRSSQGAPRQALARPPLGNAHEGKGRNFQGSLLDRCWQACRGGPGVHQENGKDAAREIELAMKRAKEIQQ